MKHHDPRRRGYSKVGSAGRIVAFAELQAESRNMKRPEKTSPAVEDSKIRGSFPRRVLLAAGREQMLNS